MASVDELLAQARARLPHRVTADELDEVQAAGALVVDTRCEALRSRDGALPGAVVVERNVLEWRLDPACEHRLPAVEGYEQTIVVVCDEGYSSSFAAAMLQDLGLRNATDLDGGFQAWSRLRRNTRMSRPERSS
jgi:rhodanese-related sulfurtransferase